MAIPDDDPLADRERILEHRHQEAATKAKRAKGLMAAEGFFEIHITPEIAEPEDPKDRIMLLPGQRVVVRFDLPPKPLIAQWWRSLLQLIQKKQ